MRPFTRELEVSDSTVWENLCGNPIHVYQLISSCRLIVDEIRPQLSSESPLGHELEAMTWPSTDDYKGSILGLLRVQYTYQLPLVNLARGQIRSKSTHARLSVDDCFFLAKERIEGANPLLISGGIDYAVAIEWAEAALE